MVDESFESLALRLPRRLRMLYGADLMDQIFYG